MTPLAKYVNIIHQIPTAVLQLSNREIFIFLNIPTNDLTGSLKKFFFPWAVPSHSASHLTLENSDKSNNSKCNYGKCNHYGKCFLLQMYSGKYNYGTCN